MNFLELCQRTRELAGISGTGPASTQNQTGEMLRVVHWVQSSWIDIQNLSTNWSFMNKDFRFTTTDGQGEYTPSQIGLANLRMIDESTLRCYQTSMGIANSQFMDPWDFSAFRDTYRYNNLMRGRPVRFACDPRDKSLWVSGIPDSTGWTIEGRAWTRPVALTLNDDVPAMPDEYHMLIPYWALSKYAGFVASPEGKSESEENKGPLLSALRNDQLPDITLGGSM